MSDGLRADPPNEPCPTCGEPNDLLGRLKCSFTHPPLRADPQEGTEQEARSAVELLRRAHEFLLSARPLLGMSVANSLGAQADRLLADLDSFTVESASEPVSGGDALREATEALKAIAEPDEDRNARGCFALNELDMQEIAREALARLEGGPE